MALDTRWKNPQGSTPEQLHLWAQDLIKELRRGDYLPAAVTTLAATAITYSNATSGLAATNVQTAIDEVEGRVDTLEAAPDPGLVLLNSGTVTAQATLDVVLTTFTAYRALKFVLTSFVPVTDDVELWMRFSTDGGANYDAGASDYSWAIRGLFNNAASADSADAADTAINLGGFGTATFAVSNVAGEGGIDAEVTLFDQTAAGRFGRVNFQSGYYSAQTTNGTAVSQTGTGARLTAQNTDAVRFLFETGNIASGKWALYGYA